jgi:hypothetical protein
MKKIIILGIMVFIISHQIFADENLNEFENFNFDWELFNYHFPNDNGLSSYSNLLGLNPVFFFNNYYGLSLNMNEDVFLYDIQRKQNIYKSSQENDWLGFLLVMAGYSIFLTDVYKNPLKYSCWENVWEHNQVEEKMYRNIIKNNN